MDRSAAPGRRFAVVGGLILLVLGLFLGWIGVAAAAAPGVEGIDLGKALAPIFLILAAPPLIAAAGILRRQRWAYFVGIIVGILYGALFLLISGGQSVPAMVGLTFLGAAIVLLDALRPRAAR
jgi:hypothetical protein